MYYTYRMELKRTSHAVYDTKYHLVWAPKYRKWILRGDIRERTKEIFEEITRIQNEEVAHFLFQFLDIGCLPGKTAMSIIASPTGVSFTADIIGINNGNLIRLGGKSTC